MNSVDTVMTLVGKDLRIFRRSGAGVALISVFGVLSVVIMSMAMGAGSGAQASSARGFLALWVVLVFCGVLCVERTARVERDLGAIGALRLGVPDAGTLYVSKFLVNVLLVGLVSAVIGAAGVMFLGLGSATAPGECAAILALGVLGLTALGTLFAGALAAGVLRSELVVLAVLPLALPLVLASGRQLERAVEGHQDSGMGLGVLVAFDVIYVVIGWMAYGLMVEA